MPCWSARLSTTAASRADRLDVVPGLAAVDEDFARRAVGIETDGDRERLVPEPQVEGLCGPALGKGSPDHGRIPEILQPSQPSINPKTEARAR